MKDLKDYINETLSVDIDTSNYFGFHHKFINFTSEIPQEYAETHAGYSKPTIIDGAPEPPHGCSLMVHHNTESGGNCMSPKAIKVRRDNKDILLSLPTIGKQNSFRSISGYASDLVGMASLMILAPADSTEKDFEKLLNEYAKSGRKITVQQFEAEHNFSIEGWGGPIRKGLIHRIFCNGEYMTDIVFEP